MNTIIAEFEIWLSIVTNIVTIIALGIGAIVAIIGVSTWKRQLKGTAENDLANKILLTVIDLREAVNDFRNFHPLYHHNNLFLKTVNPSAKFAEIRLERAISVKPYYDEKFKNIEETHKQLELLSNHAEVQWDKKAREKILLLKTFVQKIRDIYSEYSFLSIDKTLETDIFLSMKEQFRKQEEILFSASNRREKADVFGDEFSSTIKLIEDYFRNYLLDKSH